MEKLKLFNEDGSETGLSKDRNMVHRDGDLHGSAHVWVVQDIDNGDFNVLLQRRSPDKDAFPNCYDTSCAGHVSEGETFESTAQRELEEELGIRPAAPPVFLFDHRVRWEEDFHGRRFVNNEIDRVFMLETADVRLERFQKEEISALCWQKASDVLAALRKRDARYCIQLPIFEKLLEQIASIRQYAIHIGDYGSHPDAGSYAGSDEWEYHETYPFCGTREAAIAQAERYVDAFRQDTSPYIASVTYWLTAPDDCKTDIATPTKNKTR